MNGKRPMLRFMLSRNSRAWLSVLAVAHVMFDLPLSVTLSVKARTAGRQWFPESVAAFAGWS